LASTPPNGTSDLVADNFLLPRDFESSILISTSISNINVPVEFLVQFDEYLPGLYLRVYSTITNSRWKLSANENIINQGVTGFAQGNISPVAVANTALYQSFLDYTSGQSITLPTSTPTVTVSPLEKQKIFSGCNTKNVTGLADVRVELGWDFLLEDDYHLGINIQGAIPSGNHCSECLLFGPIVGNGKHWELGGGVTGHYTFWRCEDEEQSLGFYVDADITTLLTHSENRVFDLKDKPLSRYIFVEKVTKASSSLTVAGNTPNVQFANQFVPLANVAIQNVDVSFGVQGDLLAKLVYTCRGFSWELGYNFWGRTCQDIDDNCNCSGAQFQEQTYALRGSASVFGFDSTGGTAGTPRDLPASMNSTSVFSVGNAGVNNSGIDFAQPVAFNFIPLNNLPTGGVATNGSYPVQTIQTSDLNFNSGARSISNKVFTHLNYTWLDHEYKPYIGFGASGEFGSTGDRNNTGRSTSTISVASVCDAKCSRCPDCALSQWAVWFRIGMSFN
jgi:hypothetical protein